MKLDMSETISLSYVYDTYGNLNSILSQFNAHEIGLKFQLNNSKSEINEVEAKNEE